MTATKEQPERRDKITVFDFPQGSDEWDQIRRGKLTASEFSTVLGTADYKKCRLKPEADNGEVPDFGRAKMQLEVFEQLQRAGVKGMLAQDLNASGVKGLETKELLEKFIDGGGCTIKPSAAAKHIDLLVARKHYSDADLGVFTGSFATDRGNELEEMSRIDFEFGTGVGVEQVGFVMREGLSLVGVSPDGLTEDGGLFESKSPLPPNHITYLRKGVLPTEYKAQVHGQMAIADRPHCWFQSYCPGMPTFRIKVLRDNYTENLLKCLHEFQKIYLDQLKAYNIERLLNDSE